MGKALLTAFLSAALVTSPIAAGRPDAPAGFAWRELPKIEGALLVPDGWHFQEKEQGGTYVLFVTETELTNNPRIGTGATINVFRENPEAPSQVRQILERMASRSFTQIESGQKGEFATLRCRYDVEATEGRAARRVEALGLVNPATMTTYLVMFESPASEWDRAWEKGDKIVEMLWLSTAV